MRNGGPKRRRWPGTSRNPQRRTGGRRPDRGPRSRASAALPDMCCKTPSTGTDTHGRDLRAIEPESGDRPKWSKGSDRKLPARAGCQLPRRSAHSDRHQGADDERRGTRSGPAGEADCGRRGGLADLPAADVTDSSAAAQIVAKCFDADAAGRLDDGRCRAGRCASGCASRTWRLVDAARRSRWRAPRFGAIRTPAAVSARLIDTGRSTASGAGARAMAPDARVVNDALAVYYLDATLAAPVAR